MNTTHRKSVGICRSAALFVALTGMPFNAGHLSVRAQDSVDKFFNLEFAFDNSDVNLSLNGNLNTVDDLDKLFQTIGKDRIISVQAVSVSSPEGSYTYNIALSGRRANSTASFIKERFPELSDRVSVLPGSESWKELERVVESDTRISQASRTRILEILNLDCSVNDRKALMKYSLGYDENVGDLYRYLLKNWYSNVRYSGFSVTYVDNEDTVTIGRLPFILPIEKDVPSVLTKENLAALNASNNGNPDMAAIARLLERDGEWPGETDRNVPVRTASNSLSVNETSTTSIVDEMPSQYPVEGDVAQESKTENTNSKPETATKTAPDDEIGQGSVQTVTPISNIEKPTDGKAPAAKAEKPAVKRKAVVHLGWIFWVLLALLLAGLVYVALKMRRLAKENKELKSQLAEIKSEKKAEIERVRNVERVEELNVDTPDDELMRKIMDVVNENISNPALNVEFIADKIGLSRSYLHRRFKSIVQVAPASFIRSIRMNAATKMLREGKYDISQISSAVGFSSQSSFTTAFKTYYGMTPTEFLKI